jgi:hypothetical protein
MFYRKYTVARENGFTAHGYRCRSSLRTPPRLYEGSAVILPYPMFLYTEKSL